MKRKRILFVAEDASLAQVVRLFTLANALPRNQFDIHFACSSFSDLIFAESDFRHWSLYSLPAKQILRMVEKGKNPYSFPVLNRYVQDELELFDRVRPDWIVGDFRLSLSVSASYSKYPLITLINAYWSPHRTRQQMPLPEHPMVKMLGPRLANPFYRRVQPLVFRLFASPLNRLRKRHGLPSLGTLSRVLTYGDKVVYPDVPSLVPVRHCPQHHQYLGPVLWSPRTKLPAWWHSLPTQKPIIYVTLGSSGAAHRLSMVLEALKYLSVTVIVATADRIRIDPVPRNCYVANYLPGEEAAARAALTICNGGSTTAYQALKSGKPVLGIPSNLDQYLSMTSIQDAGAGILLRAGTLRGERVQHAVVQLLNGENFSLAAQSIAKEFNHYEATQRFQKIVYS